MNQQQQFPKHFYIQIQFTFSTPPVITLCDKIILSSWSFKVQKFNADFFNVIFCNFEDSEINMLSVTCIAPVNIAVIKYCKY